VKGPEEGLGTVTWTSEKLVLWSDDSLVVANKPAGLLAIRGGFGEEPYLAQILESDLGRLWIVHRLDRETSGVIVFARSAAAHRDLNTQFQERDIAKIYHALTVGVPLWKGTQVDLALRRDGDRRHRTVVDTADGRPSLTLLTVLERFPRFALLEARPRTGRTHQIRAHLRAIGFPIVGDALYGGGSELLLSMVRSGQEVPKTGDRVLIARAALHALSIAFAHPQTGKVMRFSAPYPDDMSCTLQALRDAATDPGSSDGGSHGNVGLT
jgi:tRNA pseudouridine32 synthase/23S rRNA pseudouridine746 synthase